MRGAAEVAHELTSALQAAEEPDSWRPPPTRPARRATGSVDAEALPGLCAEVGLEQRVADVLRCARVSLRLTRSEGTPGRSRLGGSPDLPAGFVWPTWNGRELGFLGQVDLAEAAEAQLPGAGLLLFFYDLQERPTGLVPGDMGSCRAVVVDGELEPDERHAPVLRPVPIEISRELMLPDAWSFHAEELELSAEETDAWDELRERLAREQGVEVEDAVMDRIALHRLLGYHDELGREVEIDCELAASGLDADDAEVYYDARESHEAGARRWRLLLQLSADDLLGTFDDDFERLYVCIREPDLEAGAFDRVWAVRR